MDAEGLRRRRRSKIGRAAACPARTRTTRRTSRATCSSGAPTCSARRARATSISSSTCSAPSTACRARTSATTGGQKPEEVVWHDEAPEGKLDLLVTLDFRMSTTCLYSDIVLPTATWYEKNDLNTSDMHPFIHPLSAAVDPVWESRSDWEIYKGIAKKFSEVCVGHLGRREGPGADADHARHAGRAGAGRSTSKDWKKGECELDPRQDRAADDGGRARLSRTPTRSSPRSGR